MRIMGAWVSDQPPMSVNCLRVRRLVGFMEKARASGEIDMTEMTVTMKSVYTFSEAGLVEPIHIVDLMNVKKELELFLMKRAMWLAICNHGIHNRTNVMMSCLNLPTC